MKEKIPGYTIEKQISASKRSIIYRGLRDKDGKPVVIKTCSQTFPLEHAISRFKWEFEIGNRFDHDNIIKYHDISLVPQNPAIILEDFDGIRIADRLPKTGFDSKQLLHIAIQLVEGLEEIQRQKIIHKDIKPDNIIINARTEQVKLTDFGMSSLMVQEPFLESRFTRLQGMPQYFSPEQTGRINRILDYRTDFYSLGVTLYELLTGHLPFSVTDPLELVHCHIARVPNAPHKVKENVPPSISGIIMKLLFKNPDDRYQSCSGLKADLIKCRDDLQKTGKISTFDLGQEDFTTDLKFPNNLSGREKETQILMEALHRASSGDPQFILISGYTGTGKTTLANSIQEFVEYLRYYFVSVSIDSSLKNSPFSAIAQALGKRVRQLLSEKEKNINLWKQKIVGAIGNNGQILIDIIPNLEKIIGPQPVVVEFTPESNRDRFVHVFKQFFKGFDRTGFPLVIFLDDIQWADPESLSLINLLMAGQPIKNFLFIGTYQKIRTKENQSLIDFLETGKVHRNVKFIHLEPLKIEYLTDIISAGLSPKCENLPELTQLVHQKTDGNPYFAKEFLKNLYEKGLLRFNRHLNTWQIDLEKVERIEVTDSVVDLLVKRISSFSLDVRNSLGLAACLGSSFNLELLRKLEGNTLAEAIEKLKPAIAAGLLSSGNRRIFLPYKEGKKESLKVTDLRVLDLYFTKNRFFEAAQSILNEEEKQKTHLKIGRLLMEECADEGYEENLFDIVFHLNRAKKLIHQPDEIERLAKLNLLAGKKTRISIAFDRALSYFKTGIELLNADSWQVNYQLSLELYTEATLTAHLTGDANLLNEYSQVAIQQAATALDKVTIFESVISHHSSQAKWEDAIITGSNVLGLLGEDMPDDPTDSLVEKTYLRISHQLEKFSFEDILNLPKMGDPTKLAAMRILNATATAAYLVKREIHTFIVLKRIELSLQYGIAPESASGFVAFSYQLISKSEVEKAHKFGDLGLKMVDKFGSREHKAKVVHQFYRFIYHWKGYLKEALPILLEASHAGLETGNPYVAMQNALLYLDRAEIYTRDLLKQKQECLKYLGLAQDLGQELMAEVFSMSLQKVAIELGETEDPSLFYGNYYDGEKEIARSPQEIDPLNYCALIMNKSRLEARFGDPVKALEYCQTAIQLSSRVIHSGDWVHARNNSFYSLVLLEAYPIIENSKKPAIIDQININQVDMKKWAENAPQNFRHTFLRIEAGLASLNSLDYQAIVLYEKSIKLCRENGNLCEEADVNLEAARHHLRENRELIGKAYLVESFSIWEQAGARAICQKLKKDYPQFLEAPEYSPGGPLVDPETSTDFITRQSGFVQQEPTTSPMESALNTIDSSSSSIDSGSMDLATVIKTTQAISSEIVLDKLLDKILQIIIENAGAEKGFIILETDNELNIEASISADSNQSRLLVSVSIEGSRELSESIVRYVYRTGEDVVIHDAVADTHFSRDPYILSEKPKSILCIPIGPQKRDTGVLYLENNLTTAAFTEDRIELLRILLVQASISLENARMFEQKKQTEEEIRQLRNYLQNIVDSMPSVLVGVDQETRITHWNKEAEKVTRYSEAQTKGQMISEIFPQMTEEMERVKQAIQTKTPLKDEKVLWRSNGETRYANVLVYPLTTNGFEGAVVRIDDITQRVQIEETMIQTEKMMSVGGLAAGMAHEINNPLGGILQGAQNIIRRISPELKANEIVASKYGLNLDDLQAYMADRGILTFLKGIRESGERAAKIISNILQFSRRSESNIKSMDLAELLENTVELANNDYDLKKNYDFRHINIIREFQPGLGLVPCTETELEQVILNLLRNSAQAMTEEKPAAPPQIIIRTLTDGPMAVIEVEDNGPGMEEATRKRIFEPFFTTKPVGSGTGLGLSVSYMIITNNHRGSMEVESEPGKGTRFIIKLPLNDEYTVP